MKRLQLMRRQVFLITLLIRQQHVDDIWWIPVVDDAQRSRLTSTREVPANLSEASAPLDEVTCVRVEYEHCLEHAVALIRKPPLYLLGEDGCFDKHHLGIIRQWRTGSNRKLHETFARNSFERQIALITPIEEQEWEGRFALGGAKTRGPLAHPTERSPNLCHR